MTEKIPKEKNAFSAPEKYHAHNVLGSGGMKIVIRSDDIFAAREVAMAIAKNSSDESQKRFLDEARITASLEHPNIVPVHEIGRSNNGIPYFTMKMVQGKTLLTILEELRNGTPEAMERYTLPVLLDIFLKVCDAISFAHSKGILHLDLKPENIQVGEFGEVLVLDWGLARRTCDIKKDSDHIPGKIEKTGGITKTVDGVIKGTPEYMAPEQALGKNSSRGAWTDVYALGALLYAILTFHAPYENDDTELVIRAVARGKFTPPHERQIFPKRPVPQALECIVYKAMSRSPSRRYTNVSALKADVEAYINGYATEAEEAGFYTNALLWLKRKRVQIYIYSSLFLIFAILISFFGTVSYLKKLEKKAYAISNESRTKAENRHAGLEEKIRKESSRSWLLRFADHFSDSYLHERWKFSHPGDKNFSRKRMDFHLKKEKNGLALTSGDTPLRMDFAEQIPGADVSAQLSFQIRKLNSNSLFSLWINNTLFSNGYWFSLNSGLESYVSIRTAEGDTLAEKTIPLDNGKFYDLRGVCIPEENGMRLELYLNEELLLSVMDYPGGTIYARHAKYAFQLRNADVVLKEMRIMTLGTAIKPDLLDIAARQLRKGNYEFAQELYIEAEDSAVEPARRRRASEGLRLTRLLMEYRSKASEWKSRLEQAWPNTRIDLHINTIGFSISIDANTRNLDLTPLIGIPVSSLKITNAKISGLKPLQSMKLRSLTLNACGIASLEDLKGLPLTELACNNNPISSLEPLKNMPLKHLSLSNCALYSIRPLKDMPLETLDLSYNDIRDLSGIPVRHLSVLNFSYNRVASLHPLIGAPLKDLNLNGNRVEDLSPLRNMPLERLDAGNNRISSLSPIGLLPLRSLNMDENRVGSIQPLQTSKTLTDFSIAGNFLSDLSPLKQVQTLEKLNIDRNKISDLEPVKGLQRLHRLSFAQNYVTTLYPIRWMRALRMIDCSGNPIESLDPLAKRSLYKLLCSDTPLDTLGAILSNPPPQTIPFGTGTKNSDLLKDMRTKVPKTSAGKPLHQAMNIAEAYYAGNVAALRAMARPVGRRKYLLIPVMLEFKEAKKKAAEFKANLPMPKTLAARHRLGRLFGSLYWIGIHRDGRQLRWDDGTLITEFYAGIPDASFNTLCSMTFDKNTSTIDINAPEKQKLPLLLEWTAEEEESIARQ